MTQQPENQQPESRNPVARGLVWLLRGYQRHISPALPPTCRFAPTCSSYAIEALQVHGVLGGGWRTVWRLLKCAPWHPGGSDPVPPRRLRPARRRSSTPQSVWNHPEEQAPC